jgi:hypothetical protein
MSGFALLWGKTLDSSLWVNESKETRLVWLTLLMMKNSEGIIQSSVVGLADRAKVSPPEAKAALKVLLSPDPDDSSKVEEGRRIREVPGGWQIVNHDMYRFSTEAKREFWRTSKAEQRENQKKASKRNGKRGSAQKGKFTDGRDFNNPLRGGA